MKHASEKTIDLAAIREKLAQRHGSDYWRSLEELAENDLYREMLQREFPQLAAVGTRGVDRRKFLSLMGASLALAGLGGCRIRPPAEQIVPYVQAPEQIVPGKPLFYASASCQSGFGTGVLVETHEGRPTKIEGNPDHPASLGATDIFAQASALTMYDPHRTRMITYEGSAATWTELLRVLRAAMGRLQDAGTGAGLRLLTGPTSSPTLLRQWELVREVFPEAQWHRYDPVGRGNIQEGSQIALGGRYHTYYDFTKADVVLALDADFLVSLPGSVRYARQFMHRRREALTITHPSTETMNRLYVIETCPSSTGAKADHRLPARASQMPSIARSVASRVDSQLAGDQPLDDADVPAVWLDAVAQDLRSKRGRCVVIAGPEQPPMVHALAHAINDRLGNVGQTVFYTREVVAEGEAGASLEALVEDMRQGNVEVMLIAECNPAYDAPADLDFVAHLTAVDDQGQAKIPLRIRLGLYEDETSTCCQWHVPQTHELEAWSDVRALDGTATIMQPTIEPLFGGRSCHELLSLFSQAGYRSGYEMVRETWHRYWEQAGYAGEFDDFWERALHSGVVADSAFPLETPALRLEGLTEAAVAGDEPPAGSATMGEGGVEVVYRPDPCIWDGRYANNGWLQELPKPITKIAWGNVALMSPATAERLGLSYEVAGHGGEHGAVSADVIELQQGSRSVSIPIWIMPGHADGAITLPLGYGRTRSGGLGTQVGTNVYPLRTSTSRWMDRTMRIHKTSQKELVPCTQHHHSMEGRHLIRAGTMDEYRTNPLAIVETGESHEPLSTLYDPAEFPRDGYEWGMAIDVTACVGCNACVVACQAENNIPVVGKAEVVAGREMHWIRLDRYYRGGLDNPETDFQPVPCMHCETAPCEVVCPVAATVHSDEGLNDMIYNRCVGTRYCSNNCPYKVRRFNFLEYTHSDWHTPSIKLLRNPDVTVRSRGVMEKCTYCVQRINHARIDAEKAGRTIRDGDVLTACQSVCPARAIHFGNLTDATSDIAAQKQSPRNYALLEHLNTRPRTTYLALVRNPNPRMDDR